MTAADVARANFARQIHDLLKADVANDLADSLRTATRATARTLVELGAVIRKGIEPSKFTTAHRTVALLAQDSVARSYDQVVTARKTVPSYRVNGTQGGNRFAGGKLRAALKSANFFAVDEHGIQFINTDLLDQTAAHWARLNAGALPAGKGSRRTFEIRWSNLVVAAIGVNMAPRPSFTIPRGYWWNADAGQPVNPGAPGTSAFYPLGTGPRSRARTSLSRTDERRRGGTTVKIQPRKRTQGIEARNFLDAGAATIARELGPTYQRLYQDFYDQKLVTFRPGQAVFKVITHGRRRN